MDTLTENYSGEKFRKDLCSDNLDKADKAGDSYGYLTQQVNENLRLSDVNRVIIGNLNINSLTNKQI